MKTLEQMAKDFVRSNECEVMDDYSAHEQTYLAGARAALAMPEVVGLVSACEAIAYHEGHAVVDISRNAAVAGFRNNLHVAKKALSAFRKMGGG